MSLLIHGRFQPLAEKALQVSRWPGIDPDNVIAAVAEARKNGTIAGYEAEVGNNPLLDIVITVNREDVPTTLLYARDRVRMAHSDRYWQSEEAYVEGVDKKRVRLLEGAKPFTPNHIAVEVIDLGANWDRKNGAVCRDVQRILSVQLAGFAALYAASQSPEWVRQMDGEKVPFVSVAGLPLNVPDGIEWACVPRILRGMTGVELGFGHAGQRCRHSALPVLRKYQR